MKVVEARTLDAISDYQFRDAPMPVAGPGQVIVEVATCGVGYVDALVSLGRYQVKPALPHIPGQEIGGWVASVGDGVSDLAPGDRVLAMVRGGFAQYALAPAAMVEKIPNAMSFEQAAGFRINYVTVLHALRDRGQLAAGETLLVIGAAGGVGSAAVQIGKMLGAKVVAVASTPEKRAFAQAQGADAAVDTQVEGWRDRVKEACGGKGPDVVFDPVCGPLFELAFRSLAWRGRHLVIGFAGGPIPALKVNLPLMKGAALVGVDVRQHLEYEPELARSHLVEMLDWVAAGRLRPPAGRIFAFEDFVAAMEFALTGQGVGKTVLEVAGARAES